MKVKGVNFKVELQGNGIVNYDSRDQKYLWNRESKNGNKNKFTSVDNNNLYAKKNYFRKENGELDYKIKISSNALRKSIFSDDAIAVPPSIVTNKVLFNSFVGSKLGLIKGYMFPPFRRSSSLTITSATQTNNAESYMEFHSRSGGKQIGDNSDKSDTTIFNKETIGEITYEAEGFINVQLLEFLSCDTIFDRYSFDADDYDILKVFLANTLPNFDSELGYYKLNTSVIDVAEYGLKLNNEQILFLIKENLKYILKSSIYRANAYAKLSKLEIELVYDVFDSNKNTFINITSDKDIDNLNFEVLEYYSIVDEEEAKKQREIIESSIKEKISKKDKQ